MSWLLENPIFILAIGGITATLVGFLWLQSGQKQLLYATIGLVVVTVVGVLIERTVTTDREQVRRELFGAAHAVERNDVRAVTRYIHSSMEDAKRRAEYEMSRFRFHTVSIKQNLEITVEPDTEPAKAKATFNVVVAASDVSGTVTNRRVPQYMEVTYTKEDGRWLISDYFYDDPQVGFQKKDRR